LEKQETVINPSSKITSTLVVTGRWETGRKYYDTITGTRNTTMRGGKSFQIVPKQSNKKVRVGREHNCSCVMFFRLSLPFPFPSIVSAVSFFCNISTGISQT